MNTQKTDVKNCIPSFNEAPVCECVHTHPEKTKIAKSHIPPDETLLSLSEFYKVFGEPTRLRILYVLYDSELCVCDIAESLSLTVSAVSHQLKILKTARLVKFRKEGKNCLYSLADSHVSLILSQGIDHINE